MNRGRPGTVSIGKGANVTCSQLEIIERPVARGPHIACYLDKPGRNSREERYLEMIEGYRQPVSNRFDVRFLRVQQRKKARPLSPGRRESNSETSALEKKRVAMASASSNSRNCSTSTPSSQSEVNAWSAI